jgi:hypothetical protein
MEKQKPKRVDKKLLTFFLIAFPTILVAAVPIWWVQGALAFYQFVLLKQFLDNYYEVLD